MALATRIPCSLVPLAICLASCAGTPGAASPGGRPPATREPPAETSVALAPLTTEEVEVAARLRATVTRLSGIGPRDGASVWNLATATDELSLLLEGMGHTVRRIGFDVGDAVAQNLEVTVAGAGRSQEVVVVGAHHDTAPGSPGANDNGSGVAALVELARAFRGEKPERTLRFALFTHEEAPYFGTGHMGSLVYARRLAAEGARVIAMMSLDSIGFYSTRAGSQSYPAGLAGGRPTVGDFVAIVGAASGRLLVERTAREMTLHASLPVLSEVHAPESEGFGRSDHWAFAELGIPALVITDTATFRGPHQGGAADLPERLDFDRMARVVVGLRKTLSSIAGHPAPSVAPTPTAPDSPGPG